MFQLNIVSLCNAAHSVCSSHDGAEHTKHIGRIVIHLYRSFRLVWFNYITGKWTCPMPKIHCRL